MTSPDFKALLKQGLSILSSALQASIKLEKTKTSTLFGVTGGLLGITTILILNGTASLPLFPALPVAFALGIVLGHVSVRSLRGFRAEAAAEAERLKFDEMVRRYKAIKSLSPDGTAPQALENLVQTFLPAPQPIVFHAQLPAPKASELPFTLQTAPQEALTNAMSEQARIGDA